MEKTVNNIEPISPEIVVKSAGFSDWQKAANNIGDRALTGFIKSMDPGDRPQNKNAHTAISERLRQLALPVQKYISVQVGDFLQNPEDRLAQLPNGDYYFASIRPGLHLAHATNLADVIKFVSNFATHDLDKDRLLKDIYISHNGHAAMSGHVIIEKDQEPNIIHGEFTVGNFNLFHRGLHTPEIVVRRNGRRFSWDFQGALVTSGNWRNEDEYFNCDNGAKLNRPEMARRIFSAITKIPHDNDKYLPGYYEILLENVDGHQTRPVFIEAVL